MCIVVDLWSGGVVELYRYGFAWLWSCEVVELYIVGVVELWNCGWV